MRGHNKMIYIIILTQTERQIKQTYPETMNHVQCTLYTVHNKSDVINTTPGYTTLLCSALLSGNYGDMRRKDYANNRKSINFVIL